MEEKNKKNEINKEELKNNFKTVQNANTYKEIVSNNEKQKTKIGFVKGFLFPFLSGALGAIFVIGTCFGIDSIRTNFFKDTTFSNTNSNNSGYVTQTSLSNYSDTAVYAANKILPSIVGIKVEYSVTSPLSMYYNNKQTRVCYSNWFWYHY